MAVPRINRVTLTTTPGSENPILRLNPTRTSAIIINAHNTAIIYFHNTASKANATDGCPIYPRSAFTLKIPEDDPVHEIWAISDTVNTPIVVYEGFGKKPKFMPIGMMEEYP